jgi:hypothetical protein
MGIGGICSRGKFKVLVWAVIAVDMGHWIQPSLREQ